MKRNRQNDKLVVKIIENETRKMITWENDKISSQNYKMWNLQNDNPAKW